MLPRLPTPHYLLVCADSYEAGWLQLHEAGEVLRSRGARPWNLRYGLWQLRNGLFLQFVSMQAEVWRDLNRIEHSGVVLLMQGTTALPEEERYYLEELLYELQQYRQVQVIPFANLPEPLRSGLQVRAIDTALPIEEQDTQPLWRIEIP